MQIFSIYSSAPAITQNQIFQVEDYAAKKHKGQLRKSVSINTGSPHDYYRTHVRRVALKASKYVTSALQFLPANEQGLVAYHPQLILVVALVHDLIEDCIADTCEKNCPRENTCPVLKKGCLKVEAELYEYLLQIGIHEALAQKIMIMVNLLTKDHDIEDKPAQAKEHMERLRDSSLTTKLIKLADQWHNALTMGGKDLQSAIKNGLKIITSWEVMFTNEEYNLLQSLGLLPSREILSERIQLFQYIYLLMLGEMTPEDHQTMKKFYSRKVESRNTSMNWQSPENAFYTRNPRLIISSALNENVLGHRSNNGEVLNTLETSIQRCADRPLHTLRKIDLLIQIPQVVHGYMKNLQKHEELVAKGLEPEQHYNDYRLEQARGILEALGWTTQDWFKRVHSLEDIQWYLKEAHKILRTKINQELFGGSI